VVAGTLHAQPAAQGHIKSHIHGRRRAGHITSHIAGQTAQQRSTYYDYDSSSRGTP